MFIQAADVTLSQAYHLRMQPQLLHRYCTEILGNIWQTILTSITHSVEHQLNTMPLAVEKQLICKMYLGHCLWCGGYIREVARGNQTVTHEARDGYRHVVLSGPQEQMIKDRSIDKLRRYRFCSRYSRNKENMYYLLLLHKRYLAHLISPTPFLLCNTI